LAFLVQDQGIKGSSNLRSRGKNEVQRWHFYFKIRG